MSLTRIGLAIVAIVAGVIAIFAIARAIDERTAPPITIDNRLVLPAIAVDLRGEIADPGVYELPSGARLDDAIAAAGGLTEDADLSQINLASRLQDGAVVTVAGVAALAPPSDAGSDTPGNSEISSSATQPTNLNTASSAELVLLPGVGDVTASRIIAYRDANGPYRSVDDLVHIDGISMRTINGLRDLVTTGP